MIRSSSAKKRDDATLPGSREKSGSKSGLNNTATGRPLYSSPADGIPASHSWLRGSRRDWWPMVGTPTCWTEKTCEEVWTLIFQEESAVKRRRWTAVMAKLLGSWPIRD